MQNTIAEYKNVWENRHFHKKKNSSSTPAILRFLYIDIIWNR